VSRFGVCGGGIGRELGRRIGVVGVIGVIGMR